MLLVVALFLVKSIYSQSSNNTFSFGNTYGNYMVLQQFPLRAQIWGTSPTITTNVTIELLLQNESQSIETISVITDSIGIWSTYFTPIKASSQEYTIKATMNETTIQLQHILFGDVYICSGQSNMRFAVSQVFNASQEIQNANNYPYIRLFTAAERGSQTPQNELLSIEESWSIAANTTIGGKAWSYFSALCWFFGKNMYDYLHYPIALIATDYCGTPVRYWSSSDALSQCNQTAISHKNILKWKPTLSDEYAFNPLISGHHTKQDILELSDSSLFNAMIYPFLRTTIKAVIWYQGESDANPSFAGRYSCQFAAMIQDWRLKWSLNSDTSPNFPFGFVQISTWNDETANKTCGNDYDCTVAAVVRYGQTANYGYVPNVLMPNTFMATAIDLGDPSSPWNSDIHSRYKQEVAQRLSNAAKNVIYGESEIYWMGPIADHVTVENERVIVNFRNVGEKGLLIKHSDGFEIYDNEKGLWVTFNDSIVVDGDYNVVLNGLNGTMDITEIRYNWYGAVCNPVEGIYNCGIYDAQYVLPATPFILSVQRF